jgi:hypothetical protein
VPLLAEAVAQSGRPNILLMVANENERTRLAAELKNYSTAGGVGAMGALAEERALPSVDVVLIAADVPDEEIQNLMNEARHNPRLERASKVIIRNQAGGMWPREALNDNTISVIRVNEGPALADAIETARTRSGGLPLDVNVVNEFALRAAHLLARLAISRGQVLDLHPGLTSLLGSLGDARPEISKAVGDTVALIESPQVQPALLDRAADPQTPEDVRASLYRSLATSAKFYGDQLQPQQIAALRQTVAGEPNQDIRSAAAEALGALNAPVQNVAQLIIQGPQQAVAQQPAQGQPAQAQPANGAQPPAATEPMPADQPKEGAGADKGVAAPDATDNAATTDQPAQPAGSRTPKAAPKVAPKAAPTRAAPAGGGAQKASSQMPANAK